MTVAMEEAVERLRSLPEGRQDELAPVLMMLADGGSDELTDDDLRAIEASRGQASRGEFATDDQERAVWAKHGL